ncbi:glutamate synthase (NADPH/NADH) large chain [Pilibacter termitis]|uniref:Glutamate synthase (NADPH/NADH) large chain n=1 Tax=Pilibacter termitis TaxID=263852 RepID=A0A1T4NFW9_9ENTE|nr:glutamate synthase large subunit [Pilibacter termitis]SJZ78013.1 glutamate synthase (NADPH/NADH) large chain [Pilibacter termitis]
MNKTLWEPTFEHDACGMGFVAQLDGEDSHTLIEYALTMLTRMNHRGGTGAEGDTGDGAGVLMAMPDEFFRQTAKEENIFLPRKNEYAVGMFFLPKEAVEKNRLETELKTLLAEEGYNVLFSRDVPVNFEQCGPTAQQTMPSFVQIVLEKPANIEIGRVFEDKLFELRRKIEKNYPAERCYVASLSSKTLCYKGMLHAYQVGLFFDDLKHPAMSSHICLTHSRFSTNTFPSWDRAQPFRFIAHNGEINTLRGAENWMKASNIDIYNEENSDSAKLENCMEYFYRHGREIPEALMMMVPESFSKEAGLDEQTASFYEYATSFVAPWDGPAGLVFTDGDLVGAALDRNGLRPSRYSLTKDRFMVVSSESGVVDFEPSRIVEKGVLGPGDVLLVDTEKGTVAKNDEVKKRITDKYDYTNWLKEGLLSLDDVQATSSVPSLSKEERERSWRAFGYTDEVIRSVILSMAEKGDEPVISMGYDSPLSVLSLKPQSLFTFFKQQFAQVTNPPIDALRESLVIGTDMYLGRTENLAHVAAENCHKIKLKTPVLSTEQFEKLTTGEIAPHKTAILSTLYRFDETSLEKALLDLFAQAEKEIDNGADILVLSDRGMDENTLALPILLAAAGLKNAMIGKGKGAKFSLVADSAEVSEVHHFACLLGYGVSAIHPYGAYEVICDTYKENTALRLETFAKACVKGIVKVMSRMGISTVTGYFSAQLFEVVGISETVVEKFFTGTTTRVGGLGLAEIEREYKKYHKQAFGERRADLLESGGAFQFKVDGEHHLFNPKTIYNFQQAVRSGDYELYKRYAEELDNDAISEPTNLRHLWEMKSNRPSVPLDEVEPVSEIVKRFKVGAMSFGSLSKEAHECIAEAMNRMGGKSNSGEGGENRNRFKVQPDGRNLNSKIKQVASGRFGVNAEYLMSAEELQIKLAQGAKPGEGGQLPGEKVFPWVAEIRGSTPGVRLISPPPHHDIYSIEDLAQLIYDLKKINPYAKINVKLVSSTGVGTIATGCVKAGADVVVISGFDGGTGASPRVSVRDAGLPLEIGLAEAHQVLSINRLRNRMTLETDGKLMTARDVAQTILLGAEEFSFASLALVAVGCVMMRVCSLNTCPVGVATQNPELRKHFVGKPEHIVNMFTFIAEHLREMMSELGFRTIDEMVGHAEVLHVREDLPDKAKTLDFSRILNHTLPIERKVVDPFAEKRAWSELDAFAEMAVTSEQPIKVTQPINNVNRTTGARFAGWLAERFGNYSLEAGKICFEYTGIAGQSFGAFATQGMELCLIGEANDYVAKGLSGGRIIVKPPVDAGYDVEKSHIVGNVACFGANKGEGYFLGKAGERFCVRNSGAKVVVEGVGDHGCEYMTGGVAVILGETGRNFGAGMSGGVAYVYDETGNFAKKCNMEMIELFKLGETTGDAVLKEMLENHANYTNSAKAKSILSDWESAIQKFVKVYPKDYRKIMEIKENFAQSGLTGEELENKTFEAATKGGA